MAIRLWVRPPRHLIALFVLLTLVPSVLLIAFGWRYLQQELKLEEASAEARRDAAADLLATALEQAIAATEEVLRDAEAMRFAAVTPDSVTTVMDGDRIEVLPHGRLLYYPVPSPGTAAPDEVFGPGEALEHAENDPQRAAIWFQQLARTAPAPVKAGALVRAARNLKKVRQPEAALSLYAEAARLATTAIGDVPTELFARSARCSLFSDLRRTQELRREALELRELLLEGRWRITRPVFEVYLESASVWSAAGEPPSNQRLALSAAVDTLWSSRSTAAVIAERWTGRRSTMSAGGSQFTVLAQTLGPRTHALIAGPFYVQNQWTPRIAPLEARHHVRATLLDAGERAPGPQVSRRSASDTGLPWTVVVRDEEQPQSAGARRILWLGGAGILICLVLAGSYVVGRAVSRELAVARLQSDFVAAVSHEFRTPLTSIRQLTEMLSDRPDAPVEKRRAYYDALTRQGERLHRLVESLLDFGRMEAGKSPYRLEQLDVDVLVGAVVEQFRSDPASRGHVVTLQRATAPAHADVDRDAMTNTLWNLLDNAAKYSPETAPIAVSVAVAEGCVVIEVRDGGAGIPPAEQAEIFRKFVRGADAKARNIPGTGIGLALVHHIVHAHRGAVSVRSEPGAGSVFTLKLPLRPAVAAPGAVTAHV